MVRDASVVDEHAEAPRSTMTAQPAPSGRSSRAIITPIGRNPSSASTRSSYGPCFTGKSDQSSPGCSRFVLCSRPRREAHAPPSATGVTGRLSAQNVRLGILKTDDAVAGGQLVRKSRPMAPISTLPGVRWPRVIGIPSKLIPAQQHRDQRGPARTRTRRPRRSALTSYDSVESSASHLRRGRIVVTLTVICADRHRTPIRERPVPIRFRSQIASTGTGKARRCSRLQGARDLGDLLEFAWFGADPFGEDDGEQLDRQDLGDLTSDRCSERWGLDVCGR